MTYTVIKDTREQQGWTFPKFQECAGMEVSTLKTGDYGIKEFPELVCIERKASPTEIALNFVTEKDRFDRELERMRAFKYRYIICEFSMDELINYPAGLPDYLQKKIKITGKYLLRLMLEAQIKYDVQIIFCGSAYNGFLAAASIIKRIYENHSGV